jgi:hypothetical protein
MFGSADRNHYVTSNPRRTSSSLRSGLAFRYIQDRVFGTDGFVIRGVHRFGRSRGSSRSSVSGNSCVGVARVFRSWWRWMSRLRRELPWIEADFRLRGGAPPAQLNAGRRRHGRAHGVDHWLRPALSLRHCPIGPRRSRLNSAIAVGESRLRYYRLDTAN